MSAHAAPLQGEPVHGPGRGNPWHLLLLWGLLAAYFCLNALTQFLTSATADLDQAEQLLLSQSLAFGYGAQPPLYTYLVSLIFSVTGPGVAPLLGLKAGLLSMTLAAILAMGHRFGFTWHQQMISVAGVVFIPQLIWESQRDLTHSVLATSLAAATLWQAVRSHDARTPGNYALLGVLIGLGLISKYNYAIFLTALLLAAWVVPAYRTWLINRHFLITLVVALLVAAPHFAWMVGHHEIATSSAHKFHAGTGTLLSGLGDAVLAALAFVTPLWIFALLPLTAVSRSEIVATARSDHGRLLLSLLAAVALLVVVFVSLSGAQQVKDRWYQPLLFFLPLLVALLHGPGPTRRGRIYLLLAGLFALLVAILLPSRTILAERVGKYSRPNMPYPALLDTLARSVEPPPFVLAESNLLAGNARPHFAQARIHAPATGFPVLTASGTGLLICETPQCSNKTFRAWLRQFCALDPAALEFSRMQAPYFYAPSRTQAIYWTRIHPASACAAAGGAGAPHGARAGP